MAREIFISYSRDDMDLVHPFVEQINQALGIDCWIDLKGIEGGDEFEEIIIKAIDECQIVLFMLSDNSLKSKWTKREVIYAEDEGKRIVPVLVNGDKLRGWFKFHFGNINFIDIHSEEQKEMLVENLRTWLSLKKKNRKAKAPLKVNEKALKEGIKILHEAQAEHEAMINYQRGNESYVKGDYEEAVRLYLKAVELGNEDAKNALERAKQNAEKEAMRKAAAAEEEEHQKELNVLANIELKLIENNGKWGFADEAGKVVIPCQWKYASSFYDGLASVKGSNDKYGFIDKTGRVVIRCRWKATWSFSDGMALVQKENGKWGYIDKTGKIAIPCKWLYVDSFSEDLARVEDDNKKWGYIDKTGKVVIPCKWMFAYSFSEGLALVKDDNKKWGSIDKMGKVVIPCEWKDAGRFSEGLARVVDDNDKSGFIDKTGKLIIPCKWAGAWSFSEGLARVLNNNDKWVYIDKTGKVVGEAK